MQWFHARRLLLCLGAGLAFASFPHVARSQDKPNKVKFLTADQVEIHGLYYPSTKKTDGPCAILLHDVPGNMREKGWDSLAAALHKQGFAVLWFDFRGHGQSTTLADPKEFWDNSINRRLVRGYRPTMPPESITLKAFSPAYLPFLINDIAAAKVFLDGKNDLGECNSANTVLIGAGHGATLGALWLKAERFRHRTSVDRLGIRPPTVSPKSEFKDYLAAIWLSISPNLGTNRYSVQQLFAVPMREKKIAMAFLHGQKDPSKGFSKAAATFLDPTWNKRAKKGKKVKNQRIGAMAIDDSDKLRGRDLLRGSLETEKWITDYLERILEDGLNDYDQKEFKKQTYVWLVRPQIIKRADQKAMVFLPPFP
jgi:pimeloyl-ACP methyl ester carboxylesterase